MHCDNIEISQHAFEQSLRRKIEIPEVVLAIKKGEIIRRYPDAQPHPCYLLLNFFEDKPLHVVVARDVLYEECWVITVYRPDVENWYADFKTKK